MESIRTNATKRQIVYAQLSSSNEMQFTNGIQWTEELSIHTNGTNRKASFTNGDFLPMVPLVRVS